MSQNTNLISGLCDIINVYPSGSMEYILATYFLNHYNNLENMNIYDIAEECATSRSSIRRFCQTLGYDNFKDYKEQLACSDTYLSMHIDDVDRHHAADMLKHEIIKCIDTLSVRMNQKDTGILIEMIDQHNRVVFYCSGMAEKLSQNLQWQMILQNKLVYVASSVSQLKNCLPCPTDEDLIIILSCSGNFARDAIKFGFPEKPHRILIINKFTLEFDDDFDVVYVLNDQSADVSLSTLATYGLTYFYDTLLYRYKMLKQPPSK